jgi:hypothetical protein
MNWIFFMGIAQGGFMLAVVTYMTKGIWSRPIRRIALAHVAYPARRLRRRAAHPVRRRTHIWPWIEHPVAGKDVWLNLPFLRVRTIFGLVVLQGISLWFTYAALRPDMGLMRDAVPPRLRGIYARFTNNWRGQEAEELHAHRACRAGARAALIYALIMGMISPGTSSCPSSPTGSAR